MTTLNISQDIALQVLLFIYISFIKASIPLEYNMEVRIYVVATVCPAPTYLSSFNSTGLFFSLFTL